MNFSFWPETDSEQCEVTYKGTTYTGYMTLCAAITRAMDEGMAMYTISLLELRFCFVLLPVGLVLQHNDYSIQSFKLAFLKWVL